MKIYDVENGIRQETPIITFIKDIATNCKTVRNTNKHISNKDKNNKKTTNNNIIDNLDNLDNNIEIDETIEEIEDIDF